MKLSTLFENTPAFLRREALRMQQALVDAGWDSKIEFTVSNTGVPCAVLRAVQEHDHKVKQNILGYYIGADSHHSLTGNEAMRWEVNGVVTTIPGIILWLKDAFA